MREQVTPHVTTVALILAKGDAKRVHVVSYTEVLVR